MSMRGRTIESGTECSASGVFEIDDAPDPEPDWVHAEARRDRRREERARRDTIDLSPARP
jgi:hypothetical protein